nr:MAG TPA: hypothetical protein [Caudoviricetes sp.]
MFFEEDYFRKIPHFIPHQHVVIGGNIDNKGKL